MARLKGQEDRPEVTGESVRGRQELQKQAPKLFQQGKDKIMIADVS